MQHQDNKTLFKHWLARMNALPSLLALCFVLLFVQSATLVHSHEGDLQPQFDCEICLKVGSAGHGIVSSAVAIEIPRVVVEVPTEQYGIATSIPVFFKARAPPALL